MVDNNKLQNELNLFRNIVVKRTLKKQGTYHPVVAKLVDKDSSYEKVFVKHKRILKKNAKKIERERAKRRPTTREEEIYKNSIKKYFVVFYIILLSLYLLFPPIVKVSHQNIIDITLWDINEVFQLNYANIVILLIQQGGAWQSSLLGIIYKINYPLLTAQVLVSSLFFYITYKLVMLKKGIS